MNRRQMREILGDLLDDGGDFTELERSKTSSFAQAGLLTHDEGVVVKMGDGSEFQITVVQSKLGKEDEE